MSRWEGGLWDGPGGLERLNLTERIFHPEYTVRSQILKSSIGDSKFMFQKLQRIFRPYDFKKIQRHNRGLRWKINLTGEQVYPKVSREFNVFRVSVSDLMNGRERNGWIEEQEYRPKMLRRITYEKVGKMVELN